MLLTGCDDSTSPLSDPKTSTADKRLVGVWRESSTGPQAAGKDARVAYYHIGPTGEQLPGSVMRVVQVRHEHGTVEPPAQLLIFPTVLGGKTYLNLLDGTPQQVKRLLEKGWKPETVQSCFLLKYQVEGDKLLVWRMDANAKERAIKVGKIKGLIEEKKNTWIKTAGSPTPPRTSPALLPRRATACSSRSPCGWKGLRAAKNRDGGCAVNPASRMEAL